MNQTIHTQYDKRGISCTIFDPRINNSRINSDIRFTDLQEKLKEKDWRIGYAHVNDPSQTAMKNTKYGEFVIGSPLSFHLATTESNTKLLTNIPCGDVKSYTELPHYIKLPLFFHSEEHEAYPKDWALNEREFAFLQSLCLGPEDSYEIEYGTIKQSQCEKWHYYRKNRITSNKAHNIYTRKRQYDTLVNYLQENKPKSQLLKIVQDAMDHGLVYEPIARETYLNVMKYELRRDITIRETGLVIQPSLFWVAASPDGMVVDQQVGIGLIKIKCPKSKSSLSPEQLANDFQILCDFE